MGRYLVTGGAGFIGSHLVESLARTGHEVVVPDDLSTGKRENLAETSRAQVVVGDVRDPDLATSGADGIFHLAAGAGFPTLRHILRPGPDIIKLDTFLTRGVDGDPAGHDSVRGRHV